MNSSEQRLHRTSWKKKRFTSFLPRRFTNLLFILLCCLILGSVLLYMLIGKAGIVATSDYSNVEGRLYTATPTPSVDSIINNGFQKQSEKFIADHVPMRDAVIISNAAIQREFTKAANLAYGFDCYPTKYASAQVEVPDRKMITFTASIPAAEHLEGAEEWVAAVSDTKRANPDIRFIYDVINDIYTTEFNPTRKYVTRYWSLDWINKHICDALSSSNVEVIYDPIESEAEFENQWFKTEHHWTLERALVSHNKIADKLGWDKVLWDEPFEVTRKWYGSSARWGLDFDYYDSLYDIPTSYDGLTCRINGEEGYRGLKQGDVNPKWIRL